MSLNVYDVFYSPMCFGLYYRVILLQEYKGTNVVSCVVTP